MTDEAARFVLKTTKIWKHFRLLYHHPRYRYRIVQWGRYGFQPLEWWASYLIVRLIQWRGFSSLSSIATAKVVSKASQYQFLLFSQYKQKKMAFAVESAWFLWNTNKVGVQGWLLGVDGSSKHQGAVFHCPSACSFTSTLYSLDVATVNLSVSSPGFKKNLWRRVWVVWVSPQCTLRSGPVQRPSSHQQKMLTVCSSDLLAFSTTPFIFQSKKKKKSAFFMCPSLPLSLITLFSFHMRRDKGLLFLLFCV